MCTPSAQHFPIGTHNLVDIRSIDRRSANCFQKCCGVHNLPCPTVVALYEEASLVESFLVEVLVACGHCCGGCEYYARFETIFRMYIDMFASTT